MVVFPWHFYYTATPHLTIPPPKQGLISSCALTNHTTDYGCFLANFEVPYFGYMNFCMVIIMQHFLVSKEITQRDLLSYKSCSLKVIRKMAKFTPGSYTLLLRLSYVLLISCLNLIHLSTHQLNLIIQFKLSPQNPLPPFS